MCKCKLAAGIQGTPHSHIAQQTSHKKFIGKNTEVTASAQDTRNGEQSGKQAYIMGAEFSRVAISRIGIGGISSP